MTRNNSGFGLSTNQTYECVACEPTNIGVPDEIAILCNKVFDGNITMKDRNKILFLCVNSLIREKKYSHISRLINSESLNDFHPSLLKSLLIITEAVKNEHNFSTDRAKVETRLQELL